MDGLNLKDKRILALLAENPKRSYTQLGKKARLSPNAARYSVQQLIKKKLILGFRPAIDYAKLGYLTYDVLFSMEPSEHELETLKKAVRVNPHIIWAALLFGKYDLYAQFLAKNAHDFYRMLKKFCEQFTFISDYSVKILIRRFKIEHCVPELSVLAGTIPEKKKKETERYLLDETDSKILSAISADALAQYPSIADKCGLSMETARNRVRNLVRQGVISNFFTLFNYRAFGYSEFFVFFKVKNNAILEEKLIATLVSQDNIKLLFRTLENELFSFCIFKSVSEFEQLWRMLKKRFDDLLIDMTYYVLSEEIKLDMWPSKTI